jgi:hypothetical protein
MAMDPPGDESDHNRAGAIDPLNIVNEEQYRFLLRDRDEER